MIAATSAILTVAAGLFLYRLCVGPSLADRTIAVSGLLSTGMAAVAAQAVRTGTGSFLPAIVALALVGSISTAIVARFIERSGQ